MDVLLEHLQCAFVSQLKLNVFIKRKSCVMRQPLLLRLLFLCLAYKRDRYLILNFREASDILKFLQTSGRLTSKDYLSVKLPSRYRLLHSNDLSNSANILSD
mgnify:CR=1 FL=1